MGRATIVAEKGEGLYTIDIDIGSAERSAAIAKYQKIISETQQNIPILTDNRDDARSDVISARNSFNASLSFLIAAQAAGDDTSQLEADVALKREILSEKESLYEVAESALEAEQSRKKEAEDKVSFFNNQPAVLRVDAWCVDYTLGLSGTVATYEVNGTVDEVVIAEGGRSPTASDGKILNPNFMSPSQSYFNAAIFDGWQKWRPTARSGVVVNVDTDALSVTIDPAISHYQNLNINNFILDGVYPVDYMGNGSVSFEPDDPVIITFDNQNYASGRVAGYRRNPKPNLPWAYFVDLGYRCPVDNNFNVIRRFRYPTQPEWDGWFYNPLNSWSYLSGACLGASNYAMSASNNWTSASNYMSDTFHFPFLRTIVGDEYAINNGHEISCMKLRNDVARNIKNAPSAYNFRVKRNSESTKTLTYRYRHTDIPYTRTNLCDTTTELGTCYADVYRYTFSSSWVHISGFPYIFYAEYQAIVYHYPNNESFVRFYLTWDRTFPQVQLIYSDGTLGSIMRGPLVSTTGNYDISFSGDPDNETLEFNFVDGRMCYIQIDDDSVRQSLHSSRRQGKRKSDGLVGMYNYNAGSSFDKAQISERCKASSSDWDSVVEWI